MVRYTFAAAFVLPFLSSLPSQSTAQETMKKKKLFGPITMHCPNGSTCTPTAVPMKGVTQHCSSQKTSCSDGVCESTHSLSCDSNYLECDSGCSETKQPSASDGSSTTGSTIDTGNMDMGNMDMGNMDMGNTPTTTTTTTPSGGDSNLDCATLLAEFPNCKTCVYTCGNDPPKCDSGFSGCSATCFSGPLNTCNVPASSENTGFNFNFGDSTTSSAYDERTMGAIAAGAGLFLSLYL